MQVIVTSTTDTPEAVTAAQGSLVAEPVVEPKESAPAEKADETPEEPETSEPETPEEGESDEKEDTDPEDAKPKKKGGFKRRIDKLNSKLSAAEQEALYWRQEALKHQRPEEMPVETVVDEPTGRPKADSFDTHEEYIEALSDWKVEQRLSAHEIKLKETQIKSEQAAQANSFRNEVDAFKATTTDFDDVLEEVEDIKMSITVQQAILGAKKDGPKLMYELAKNREEYERICKLPAIDAAMALGEFRASLKASVESKETAEPKTTKAPAPIKPLGAKGGAPAQKSPDDMSYEEYKKWREGKK